MDEETKETKETSKEKISHHLSHVSKQQKDDEKFIFKFYAKEGYCFKIFSDLLKNRTKKCNFTLHPKGIFLKIADSRGVAIQAKMPSKRFAKYFCPKQIEVGVNVNHFQKMLKPVKKKDSLTSAILVSKPDKFMINPKRVDITTEPKNSVKIINIPLENILVPKNYDPELEIVCTNKNFQSVIKNISGASGKKLEISGYGKKLRCYCNNNDLMESDDILKDIEENDDYFPEDTKELDYCETFNPQDIICLNKCVSLTTSDIKICRGKNLPLRIIIDVKIIELTIFIKSRELIEKEENDKKNNTDNDIIIDENVELIEEIDE
jgi:hypothetical protein